MQPDETKTDTGRQTKTLSGGEKSFATICLLLALWEAMGSPIRCLDEFDVFMDNINRDISLRMMISTARRSMGRQYILITPQSMGSVDVKDDIRIIKWAPPSDRASGVRLTAGQVERPGARPDDVAVQELRGSRAIRCAGVDEGPELAGYRRGKGGLPDRGFAIWKAKSHLACGRHDDILVDSVALGPR